MCQETYKKICDTTQRYAIIDAKGDVLVRRVTLENAERLVEDIKKTYKRKLTIVKEEDCRNKV